MFKEKRDIAVLIGLEKMLSFATPPPLTLDLREKTYVPSPHLVTNLLPRHVVLQHAFTVE